MNVFIEPLDKLLVKKISEDYELPVLVSSILVRRKITSKEAIKFFVESHQLFLNNPFNFYELSDAVNRILVAIDSNEKILIYGDRDVDGITATVVLFNALKNLGADVIYAVPNGDEDYSIKKDDIDKHAKLGVTLIVTVDCGISSIDEVDYASELGIDFIVTDHHNPSDILPAAVAILDPKIEDSGYPFKNISGCCVASKLAYGLYFSKIPFFDKKITLLNIFPANNETYNVEVISLQNMVELDRHHEIVLPNGKISSKLNEFFDADYIYVYNIEYQNKMVQKAFNGNFSIQLNDILQDFDKFFPHMKKQPLLTLLHLSKILKYNENSCNYEIDVLAHIFNLVFYKKYESFFHNYFQDMDLVMLSVISDLMPMENENRIIVKNGLNLINNSSRAALREILFMKKCFKDITSLDIAWKLVPILNSTGRLGKPYKAIELLLETDHTKIKQLAEEIWDLNSQRCKLGEDVWKIIYPKAKVNFEKSGKKFVFVSDKQIHRGVTGLTAMKLSQQFNVPAMIATIIGDKIIGSVRSVGNFNAKNFLENFSSFLLDFGGHDGAAGFSLKESEWKNFATMVKEYIINMEPIKIENILTVDAIVNEKVMGDEIFNTVELFKPYGEGNLELNFLLKSVYVENYTLMGKEKEHLKLNLKINNNLWSAIYWNAATLADIEFKAGDYIDIVFNIRKTSFNDETKYQIFIVSLEKSQPAI